MPGQNPFNGFWGDGTWTEPRTDDQQVAFINVPPHNEPVPWLVPAEVGMQPVGEATRPPDMSRAELEIDRNHWKREAERYKRILMDMLGKEVE